jgi:hypothetical protein
MLKDVGFEYGEEGDEYKLVGGVRINDRIRKGCQTRVAVLVEILKSQCSD